MSKPKRKTLKQIIREVRASGCRLTFEELRRAERFRVGSRPLPPEEPTLDETDWEE